MTHALAGVWPPVSTPFGADGSVAYAALVRHSRRLLAEGAQGLAVLGTTSEANSLTLAERLEVIDAHIEAGIEPGRLLPGTGACAVDDVVALTRRAGEIGAAGVLLLPPFYYKKVADEGIFRFVATVIERAGAAVPRIMLYHIPPVASVGWSLDLTGRLRDAYPGIVMGMKDSSGDFDHTAQMIAAFPDLAIFPGAETTLLKTLRLGAAGCISATANVNVGDINALYERWREPEADALQDALKRVRAALEAKTMIPALKVVLAARYGDPAWRNVRPPLLPVAPADAADLLADPELGRLVAPASM